MPRQPSAKTPGVARPTCPTNSSERKRTEPAGFQSPARPPCLARLTQPCAAFHNSTGVAQARPMAAAAYNSPAGEPAPGLWHSGDPDADCPCQQDGGVFAAETQAAAQTDAEPPPAVAGSYQPRERSKRCGPEQEKRRVGRDDDGAGVQHERGVQQNGGGDAGSAPGPEILCSSGDEERSGKRRPGRQKAYAKRRVAEYRRPDAYPESDHRRVVEVATLQMLGPDPVVGLVGGQRGGRCHNDTERSDRE